MLRPQEFFDYQKKAVIHQLSHDDSMLWLDTGLGKTPVTLTTIEHRMRAKQVTQTLVIGPVRVIAAVWEREAKKWEHLQHLTFSLIHGDEQKRLRAMSRSSDIHLINYENLAWFSNQLTHYYLDQGKPIPYQMIVYDEVSKMKNSQSQRMSGGKRIKNRGKPNETVTKFVGWKKIIPHFKYRTGLTGTPASNGYEDLFGQYMAIDGGKRFGQFITHFRDSYFYQNYNGFGVTISEIGKQLIEGKIADITIKMDAEDYLKIPAVTFNNIWVDLAPKVRRQYNEIEDEMFTKLDDGVEIELFNKSSISNKCLQFANGGAYVEPGKPEFADIHDEKIDVLSGILEEAGGSPVLVGYSFKFDAIRIMKKFKHLKPVNLTEVSTARLPGVLDSWGKGDIKLLIGHPASMGHGVDGLQDSGHIMVWFGLPWSLELYYQMIGRLKRTGQKKGVIIHQILARETVDLAVLDSLRHKATSETGLKQSIQRYRDGMISEDLTFM
tara:strand:+ start:1239 stop:2720 length:1482 start_codon:yes stop_codon:yes gene_type:complete